MHFVRKSCSTMRTIMNTNSLVSENVRGTALAFNAFPFLAPYRSRESSFSWRHHFYSNVPLHKKHISCSNTCWIPKEVLVLLATKRTLKRGKESLASEQAHCLWSSLIQRSCRCSSDQKTNLPQKKSPLPPLSRLFFSGNLAKLQGV